MMNPAMLTLVLKTATAVAVAGSVWLVAAPLPTTIDTGAREEISAPPVARPQRTGEADSIVAQITSRNPFRVHRSPARVRFNPNPDPGEAEAPPPRALPAVLLVGLILDSDPSALLDGIPGVTGARLLRAGERAGEVTLRSIGVDFVTIAMLDTTVTLRLRGRP